MKRFLLLAPLFLLVALAACQDDGKVTETVEFMVNEPIFMPAAEFRSQPVLTKSAQPIGTQGKLCFYGGYLYVSEPEAGIHIIDNRNPQSPQAVGFVDLEGNVDLAVRNGRLYADSYVDLVWFDLTDPARPAYAGRLENVFKYALPCIDNEYSIDYGQCFVETDRNENIVVGWKLVKRKETYTYYTNREYVMMDAASSGGGSSNGVNGSMSRFSLYQDYLYTVVDDHLSIFDLAPAEPVKAADDVPIWANVETIFSYGENMFMGTPTGMVIYSVKDPLRPEYMSMMWHVYGCDPVVVENDIAYVTVHSGNFCGQNNNELIIIDVSDVKSPNPIVSYTLTKPKGLGIDNGTLFVCDDGLRIFDAAEPQKIMANELAHYKGMEGYDVIPLSNVLMMIADDGLYQYDYSNLKDIRQISRIKIGK